MSRHAAFAAVMAYRGRDGQFTKGFLHRFRPETDARVTRQSKKMAITKIDTTAVVGEDRPIARCASGGQCRLAAPTLARQRESALRRDHCASVQHDWKAATQDERQYLIEAKVTDGLSRDFGSRLHPNRGVTINVVNQEACQAGKDQNVTRRSPCDGHPRTAVCQAPFVDRITRKVSNLVLRWPRPDSANRLCRVSAVVGR